MPDESASQAGPITSINSLGPRGVAPLASATAQLQTATDDRSRVTWPFGCVSSDKTS